MTYTYDLTLGLPHTNHRFFAEQLMLKFAGHFQWQSIAAAAGLPLSSLRTVDGGEVYASFYYIETVIPASAPLESFRLDDTVRFAIDLRAFKNIAFEGRVRFDRPERLNDATSPSIRFANIFITPEQGNSRLRVAPPAQTGFENLPPLPNEENPYHLTRAASESGTLGVLDEEWLLERTSTLTYAIDVDRDTNGAGLVYFANYVAFMDIAERRAVPEERERSLRHRRIAYYGNAAVDDTLTIDVTVLRSAAHPDMLGFRYTIRRQEDGAMICLSEAIKALA
ncbi:MAG TPA: LnmK family bifunctional acyltransferase/decarboxylase [Thermoanaerobaculia bacterium]|jgi:probable biosynthetic protein (TIGR04098 family)|nr:LnmK family bifunctional acyltransferase/decarboxylase [Thermoanaerobaculia bacterium]